MHLLQKEYGWKDSYILHDWRRDNSDFLPYERWIQKLEIIRLTRMADDYQQWRLAAFHGYQNYQGNPYIGKAGRAKNFDDYCKKQGLRDPIYRGRTKKEEIAAAHAVWAELGLDHVDRSLQSRRENRNKRN